MRKIYFIIILFIYFLWENYFIIYIFLSKKREGEGWIKYRYFSSQAHHEKNTLQFIIVSTL